AIRVKADADVVMNASGGTNIDEALAPRRQPSPAPMPPSGPRPAPAQQVRLPQGLKFDLEIEPSSVRVSGTDPALIPGGTIELSEITGHATYAHAGPVDVSLTAQPVVQGRKTEPLKLGAKADALTNADGTLRTGDANGEVTVSVSLPQVLSDALAARAGLIDASGIGKGSTRPGGEDGALRVSAGLKLAGGKVTSLNPASPPTVVWRAPEAILAPAPGAPASVALQSPPVVTLIITDITIPAAALAGGPTSRPDWRGAGCSAALTVSALTGTMAFAPGDPARGFRTEPLTLTIKAPDLAQGIDVNGGARIEFDDKSAGMLNVVAKVGGALDEAGAIRTGLPRELSGVVAIERMPTAPFEPLMKQTGLTLAETVGEFLNARLGASSGGTDSEGAAPLPAGATKISFSMSSPRINSGGDFVLTSDRLRTGESELRVTYLGPRRLIERYVEAMRGRMEGDGTAILNVRDVDMPLVGGTPDLKNAGATARFVIGGMTAKVTGADGREEAVELSSLDTTVERAPGGEPKLSVDYRLAMDGKKFATVGTVELPGLLAWPEKSGAVPMINAQAVKPVGKIELIDVPSGVASLVSARAGEIARAALGPKVGAVVEASAAPGGSSSIVFRAASEGLDARGKATIESGRVVMGPDGLVAEIKNAGRTAGALAGGSEAGATRFADGGTLKLTIGDAAIPLPGAGSSSGFDVAKVNARVGVEARDVSATIAPSGGGAPVAFVSEATKAGVVLKDGSAKLTLDMQGKTDGRPVAGEGTMTASLAPLMSGALDAEHLKQSGLDGTIKLTRVPVALASAVAPKYGDVAHEVVGDTVDLEVTARNGESFDVNASGERLTLQGGADAKGSGVDVRPLDARVTLTPGAVAAAKRAFAPERADLPALDKPVVITAKTRAFSVALGAKEAAPLMERIGAVSGELNAEGDIVLSGIKVDDSRRVGAIIRGLKGEVAADPRDRSKSRATLSAELLNPDDAASALAKVEAGAALSASPVDARVSLANVDTARVDRWLGREGLLAEILGDRAEIAATVTQAGAESPMRLGVDLKSPVMKTAIKADHSPARTVLVEPAVVEWTMSEKWGNQYLFAADEQGQRSVSMKGSTPVRVELKKLSIGPTETPLAKGAFDLDCAASAGALDLTAEDGRSVRLGSTTLTASALPGQTGGGGGAGVKFNLSASDVGSGGAKTSDPMRANGQVTNLADERGALTTDRATVTMDAGGTFPTALVDALTRSGTLYSALLGPTTSVTLNARDLSKTSGQLQASVKSEYSSADVKGTIGAGQFRAEGPVQAKLTRITPEASKQLFSSAMPLLENIEKTEGDRPASLDARNLTVPVDKDMKKLNGDVTVDLGTVRFKTSSTLGSLLDLAKVKTEGTAGQRVEPFVAHIENGVARYERFKVPLGEFSVETEGVVNLDAKTMDLMVYVPFFAVSKELAGLINNDLTAKLGKIPVISDLTMIPVRVEGPINNPRKTPKFEKAIMDAFQKSLKEDAGKFIEKGIQDLLNRGKKKP
ncbi:MAG TPA: AsmA-like C-terminal region-containing protein, partial [Phycisphaerales bacterium]|nr:AsmA-like C-terminal region-containing protein [Phycisphaerales bacterium]